MGKGDKKSKRGKIILGSHGVSRPRRKNAGKSAIIAAEINSGKPEAKQKVTVSEPKEKAEEPKSKVPKKPKTKEMPESDNEEVV